MFRIKNVHFSLTVALTLIALFGLKLSGTAKTEFWYIIYGSVMFMVILGVFLITQIIELYRIWGNIPLMTAVAFLLCTNLAQTFKILMAVKRRKLYNRIILESHTSLLNQKGEALNIVKRCDRELKLQLLVYVILTAVTLAGWAASAEKNRLPLSAWYPYDVSKSPAYELTYIHQITAIHIAAFLNVAKDVVGTSLIAQSRCRLELLNLSLRKLHDDLNIDDSFVPKMLTSAQDDIVNGRLKSCIINHQAILRSVRDLRVSLYEFTFVQFSVSTVIICVTAFQLSSVNSSNFVRLLSMGTYLMNMMYQVFIYCYHGNKLTEESYAVSNNAYECGWYISSIKFRKLLLILMMRTQQFVGLSAAGFAALSLSSFMAILKASYSFFTVLQQLEIKH